MAGRLADPPGPAREDLQARKRAWVRAHRPGALPSNVDWIHQLPVAERARFDGQIRRKPTRSLSGVAIVAVMTAPARCPHGRCTYCPGGLELGTPQSYTGEEPSALRGAQFGWDARAITAHRIQTLDTLGHATSKVEAIVMGGTFTARPVAYQESVLQGIYEGLNGAPASNLPEAQQRNETADHRLVSLTVETRPDGCAPGEMPRLLRAGVTRIEIGVECLRDEVLAQVNRAHTTAGVQEATRTIRDFGLKLAYHLMPGLPGMDPARDLADLRRLFADPTFRPDMIKIYPTLVLPNTPLYDDWKAGRYEPYGTKTAVELLATAKAELPAWVRVQRIQRDIPARLIAAGVRPGNLRELVHRRMEANGTRCRCLRCREPGRRATPPPASFEPREVRYAAAGGEERFLSIEDPVTDTVAGFLRLRFPGSETPGGLDAPVIRELKVLGTEVAVGRAAFGDGALQHRGFGRALVRRAEIASADAGFRHLYVTSAVGTREYYRRLGFEPAGTHLAKPLFP